MKLATSSFPAGIRGGRGFDPTRANGAALGRPEDGPKAPLANGEGQCLACRLQRNFGPGLMRHATPEVAPTLSATGRAPPLS